jgi:[protein-PII] uridylyltransferase
VGADERRRLAERADDWLAELLVAAIGDRPEGDQGLALVAVGGYGRGELSPGSDLDLLLLHTGRPDIAAVADRLWYPIWDAGVPLDHAVRTLEQVRAVAAADLPVALGVLEARHIAGDRSLTDRARAAGYTDWRASAARRLPELRELCAQRAERHGHLAFLLEGDVKEAGGGLRDAGVLRAVAASWVADGPRAEVVQARHCLLDVRDALHRCTGRRGDRLLLQEQDAVADLLGLADGDALLRRVSAAARTIGYASEVCWRQVGRALRASSTGRRGGAPRGQPVGDRSPLADGVVAQAGEAVLARDAQPAADPVLLLRAAAAAAQAGVPLAPHAARRLAAECPPLPVPWPAAARQALVSLLGAGAAVVPVWEALEAHGVIERLLPDWARVRHRPQHNAVHRFTVDRHLVETAAQAAKLTRRVGRPDLLLVAALLHDIGKGWPGDHSVTGAVIARDLAVRMGFDPPDVDTLALLVREHLVLAEAATTRDLDDPATIQQVAARVGGVTELELLHALTEADGLATGPAAWTDWRAALVDQLVARTLQVLHGTPAPPPPALAPRLREWAAAGEPRLDLRAQGGCGELVVVLPDQRGLLALVAGVLSLHRVAVRSASADLAGAMAVQVWSVEASYGSLPELALLRADLRRALTGSLDVAARLARREQAASGGAAVRVPPPYVRHLPDASRSATVVEVRAHDGPALLHRIASALATAGADVRQARISTWGAEAVDTFYVVGRDGAAGTRQWAGGVVEAVREALGASPPAPVCG